ncbi:DNA-binding protein [Streptomyces poriticola]|uniref:DNA-binding protein n=1 Tax=Streptomyces poriticola TaxID=3120506 RepID=UPI002FCE4352
MSSIPPQSADAFTAPSAHEARVQRAYTSLFRIAERHAVTDGQRRRQTQSHMISPYEAVRLVSFLLSGAAQLEGEEPEVDRADITAALSLLPLARAEMDEVEVGILKMAHGRGMTWSEIAFGLGLETSQAARQRYERLASRTKADVEKADE